MRLNDLQLSVSLIKLVVKNEGFKLTTKEKEIIKKIKSPRNKDNEKLYNEFVLSITEQISNKIKDNSDMLEHFTNELIKVEKKLEVLNQEHGMFQLEIKGHMVEKNCFTLAIRHFNQKIYDMKILEGIILEQIRRFAYVLTLEFV